MGAWSEGIYGNDTALNALGIFEDHADANGIEDAIELIKKDPFYGKEPEAIFVIADLEIKHYEKISKSFYPVVKKALEEELGVLDSWTNPEERKEVLLKFQQKIEIYK